MKLETHITPETVNRIYANYVSTRKNEHRPHLGGSQIGKECSRALWYQFRHAWTPKFEGRMLRLFETGDREEERIVRNLRDIGVEIWEVDPDTGKQIRFTECGGHFALSLDGIGVGFPESKQPHTLEFKTMNTKTFRAMSAKGLQEAHPTYWAQCQVGMHLADIDRCYFFAVCKETDAIYAERVKRNMKEGKQLIEKAKAIVFSDTPPPRIADEISDWRCKFCPYLSICQGVKIPEVHCRTCAHTTPEGDGTWQCVKQGRATETLCNDHLFIPDIMPKYWVVVDTGDNRVEYHDEDGEQITNRGNSLDLYNGRMKG